MSDSSLIRLYRDTKCRTLLSNEFMLYCARLFWCRDWYANRCQRFLEVSDIRRRLRVVQFYLIRSLFQYLLNYLRTLKSWIARDAWEECPIARTAWSILRDSYVDPSVIISQAPQNVALAVLNISLRTYGIKIPYADSGDRNPWWKILYHDSSESKLNDLSKEILNAVYKKEK